MGNWTITIHGSGGHHNQHPGDSDSMAKAFAESLVKVGHNIELAIFTSGRREDLLPSPASRDVNVEVAALNNEVHRLRANLAARSADLGGTPDNIVPVDFTPPEFSA